MGEHVAEEQLLPGGGRELDRRAPDRCPAVEVVGVGGSARLGARYPGARSRRHVPELLGAAVGRCYGVGAGESTGRRRVGAVRVHAPAPPDLQVVVERTAARIPDDLAQDAERTPSPLGEVQDGALVPAGLRCDARVVEIVAVRQLERVGIDPIDAVRVVAGRARGDVQVARLLGSIAVAGGHLLADVDQRVVVGAGHVARDVRHRVAIRPHDQAAGLVERDVDTDLLPTADDATSEEVAHRTGLRRRERPGSAVGDGLRVRACATAAAPAVAEVAVEIRPDVRRTRGRLAVLAPSMELAGGDVVLGAIGVEQEDDPDLAAVDDLPDAAVRPVAIDQPAHDLEGHLDAHVLVRVGAAVVEDLRLRLVGPHVVGDLHGPQFATVMALADRDALGDVRMGRDDGLRRCADLRVGVVALVSRGELVRGEGGGGEGDESAERDGGQRRPAAGGAAEGGHAAILRPMARPAHPSGGPATDHPNVRARARAHGARGRGQPR